MNNIIEDMKDFTPQSTFVADLNTDKVALQRLIDSTHNSNKVVSINVNKVVLRAVRNNHNIVSSEGVLVLSKPETVHSMLPGDATQHMMTLLNNGIDTEIVSVQQQYQDMLADVEELLAGC